MGNCYNKIDAYFFPEDNEKFFALSVVAPLNVYRAIKYILCPITIGVFCWS